MNILAFDTSGMVLSIALKKADGKIFSLCKHIGLKHSEALLPSIEALFTDAGIGAADRRFQGHLRHPLVRVVDLHHIILDLWRFSQPVRRR